MKLIRINAETYRQAKKKIILTAAGNYLVEYSNEYGKKFYLERSVTFRLDIETQFASFYKLNRHIKSYFMSARSISIYEYNENLVDEISTYPIETLLKIYNNSTRINSDDFLVKKSLFHFLEAWPKKYHKIIKSMTGYRQYSKLLKATTTLSLCIEHGDYTKNNIKRDTKSDKIYLLDFEFVKINQPIGFDMLDYLMSTNSKHLELVPNLKINIIKYKLINKINKMLDSKHTKYRLIWK